MNYELWISYRYLMAKKDRFLSIINIVSILGIAIGVAALIIVIGVMSGFDQELREKIVGTTPHVLLEKEVGIRNYMIVQNKVLRIPGIKSATPYIHGNVFLESGKQSTGLLLRGVDPATEGNATKIDDYLHRLESIEGLGTEEVIMGSQLANFYGITVGQTISLIAPASGVAGEGWRYELKVVDVFTSGMYDFDRNLIIVHLNKAQEIFALPDDLVTGIGIKVDDIYQVDETKRLLYDLLGYSYYVRTWIENNAPFFAALKLEKLAMFIILTLIVLVASFNIISTMIVTVTSKVKDIGILKSIGVTRWSIRKIFIAQGLSLGAIGTLSGFVFGAGVCWALKKYQFIRLPQEIYYIDRLPVLVQWQDVLWIVGSAMTISLLATIYPAHKAANLEPVEALRYE